jgi:hypothetical protein
MIELNQVLLILHLLGMSMGLAVSFSSIVVQGLAAKASAQEKPVLARAGDMAAAARIPIVGRFAFLAALTAVVFAVLTFD